MIRFSFFSICFCIIISVTSYAGVMEPGFPGPEVPDTIVVHSTPSIPDWLSIWKQARLEAGGDNLYRAVREYNRLLSLKPNINEARWELARVRAVQGEYDQASDLLEKLLPEYRQRLEVMIVMAHVQEKLGHSGRALQLYKKALDLRGNDIDALSGAARCLLAEQERENALPYLERLYKLADRDRELAEILAGIYYNQKSYRKTLSVLVPLIDSESFSVDDLLLAAKSKSFLGDRNGAFTYWQKLLKQDEKNREAHKWLADYHEEEENWRDALSHLLILQDLMPQGKDLSLRIARCYARLNEFENGLKFVKEFLAGHPDDRDGLRLLINIYASLDREDQTLAALDRYFAVEPKPSPEKLKQAARLYDARGRYKEAIPLYKKLIKNSPDDKNLLKTLADDLLAIGEDEGALNILNQLATISPDTETYQAMAELLEKLNRHDELTLVLERLHIKEPANPEPVLKLISLYLQQNEKKRAEVLYREIADQFLASRGLLEIRAGIAVYFGMEEHALRDYSSFLEMQYDEEICFRCIGIAGRLGLVADLKRYTAFYLRKSAGLGLGNNRTLNEDLISERVFRKIGADDYLGIAKAWREAFLDDTSLAMYKFVIDKPGASRKIRFQAFLGMAELYRQEGRVYKAEEAYRLAMAVLNYKYRIMGRLVETFFEHGDHEKATAWLSLMEYVERRKVGNGLLGQLPDRDRFSFDAAKWYGSFLALELSFAEGAYRDAVDKGEELFEKIVQDNAPIDSDETLRLLCRVKELLAAANIYLHDFERAGQLIDELDGLRPSSLAPEALEIIMSHEKGETVDQDLDSLLARAGYDLGLLRNLQSTFSSLEENGQRLKRNWNFTDRIRRVILAKNRDNLRASIMLCRSTMDKGRYREALVLCRELLSRFPGSLYPESMAADIYYRLHMETKALSYCDKVLARDRRPGILLLKARIVWRSDRREGLSIIESYLEDPAEKLVREAAARRNVSLPPRPERSLWEKFGDKIIRGEKSGKKYLDVIMEPDFFIGSADGAFFNVVYKYYARYRWQQILREEASARQAFIRGEYFGAAHHFTNLLTDQEHADISLLFDLARVYGKLGRFEDEAFLYSQLKRFDADFPGLDSRIRLNQLQLRPRFALKYHYLQEEGWDGYKAMEKSEGGGSYRYLFTPREQLELSASHIRYDPTGGVGEPLSAKRLVLSSKGRFLMKSTVKLGAGVEFLNFDNTGTGLFFCKIGRKFADDFDVGLSFEREVVADTYASLTRNVVSEDSRAFFSWDISSFFSAGGDYGLISYSDSNKIDEYSLWTKCHIFGKPSYLTFSYRYKFKDADESKIQTGSLLPDGFRENDHPYWSPRNYWENSFSLNWEQPISSFLLEHESPSYYSASFTFDYDERGQVRQTLAGGIYLEWSHSFIGRSFFKYTASENYDVREFSLAAIYRW